MCASAFCVVFTYVIYMGVFLWVIVYFCVLDVIPVQIIVSDHLIYQSLWSSIYFFHHDAGVTGIRLFLPLGTCSLVGQTWKTLWEGYRGKYEEAVLMHRWNRWRR